MNIVTTRKTLLGVPCDRARRCDTAPIPGGGNPQGMPIVCIPISEVLVYRRLETLVSVRHCLMFQSGFVEVESVFRSA